MSEDTDAILLRSLKRACDDASKLRAVLIQIVMVANSANLSQMERLARIRDLAFKELDREWT